MEIHTRRHNAIQDLENVNAIANKGKSNLAVPLKRQVGLRGALGDVNTNIQAQRDVALGKVACAAAEIEKKNLLNNRGPLRTNYNHVQSKVDTGRALKPLSRPPLRREESTNIISRVATRTRTVLKETQEKTARPKTATLQLKKTTEETKKTTKSASLKEQVDKKGIKPLKPILEERQLKDSLGKLNLTDKTKDVYNVPATPVRLPADIEDIDAADKNSPLLMSIYIKDIYKYLTELELRYPIEEDHLRKQTAINERMRATLIDWLVEVQCQFSLVAETFQITVGIIDRYLQVVPNVQRNRLQLIGVTAMYIASKYEEIYAPDVGDFIYVTDHTYTKEDLFQCEKEILSKLDFCLARPIPLSFLRRFIKAAHGTSKHHHLAKYFVELSLVEYSMAHYRPSELAAAALCLSLYLLSSKKLEEVWTPTLAYYSRYDLQHLEPIVKKIAEIVVNVEKSKNKAVPKKYLDLKLAKVSALPQLKGDAIYELIQTHSSSSSSC